MKRKKNRFLLPLVLLGAFLLWTAAVRTVDVRAVGPLGSRVGFAAWNSRFHHWTGVHWGLYTLTDWLGLVPIIICTAFAALGFLQLVRRRSLGRVDADLLLLGGFYGAVAACFLLFELFPVNYRPVLIEGRLEASYPSSTTLLVMCVMPTTWMQLRRRLGSRSLLRSAGVLIWGFTAFMVAGRALCGVHWITDILGGAVLSAALVTAYGAVLRSEC